MFRLVCRATHKPLVPCELVGGVDCKAVLLASLGCRYGNNAADVTQQDFPILRRSSARNKIRRGGRRLSGHGDEEGEA